MVEESNIPKSGSLTVHKSKSPKVHRSKAQNTWTFGLVGLWILDFCTLGLLDFSANLGLLDFGTLNPILSQAKPTSKTWHVLFLTMSSYNKSSSTPILEVGGPSGLEAISGPRFQGGRGS